MRNSLFVLALAAVSGGVFAQDAPKTLTLTEALRLAKEKNGTIRAAVAEIEAARAREKQSFASFFPTLTPSFNYTNGVSEQNSSQFGKVISRNDRGQTQVDGNIRLIDGGQRGLTYRAAQRQTLATEDTLKQTLRQTLFTVLQQYYETLRAQELQKVADAQVLRTDKILDQTVAQIDVGATARKDRLQARADALNARVSAISARSRTATNASSLKATLGLSAADPLAPLEPVDPNAALSEPTDLAAALTEGLAKRPDIASRRKSIDSQRLSLKRLELEAGATFSLDGNASYIVTPDKAFTRNLTFSISYPLFDGGLRREQVREQRAQITSAEASLAQFEQSARSEIESAFIETVQNQRRLEAAKLALEAAQLNYAAAVGSKDAGASTLIDVLTAQVSLVTAESNYVEAIFDELIAELRLKLATGRELPGE